MRELTEEYGPERKKTRIEAANQGDQGLGREKKREIRNTSHKGYKGAW